MKIVADENILCVENYFGHDAEITLKPGRSITAKDVKDADILLVRSVTPVNQTLLENSSVKFVGCVTTGTDHMDTQWLDAVGIAWASAAGCNADAVKEYVLCTIAALRSLNYLKKSSLRAGVIGVGRIGSRVAEALKSLGFEVLLCDPLRAQNEKNFPSISLAEMSDLDFITLHTPLTRTGRYPTFHMIDEAFLKRQESDCILLNTSRGALIDTAVLKKTNLPFCLDVWENEPNIDLDLLRKALIATPHIAGYSVQSKYRGIEMIYDIAVAKKLISPVKQKIDFPSRVIAIQEPLDSFQKMLQIYNPLETSQHMKDALLNHKESFDKLRKNFMERHEFGFVTFKTNLGSSI